VSVAHVKLHSTSSPQAKIRGSALREGLIDHNARPMRGCQSSSLDED
jgi:hypothetical protein